ncbi:MAG: hypothetical protein IT371_17995 [Deltaproteobacteria bacterium]|nr:hypothetical protein [Deltaproteobacteria bacterium]
MTKDALLELFGRASGAAGKGAQFTFEERQEATVFIAGQGALLTVDRVREVDLSSGSLQVRNARGELYFVDPTAVLGLKVRAVTEGAGFVPK